MSAPMRLVTKPAEAPKPLLATLQKVAAADVPGWIGAKASVVRPLLAARADVAPVAAPVAPVAPVAASVAPPAPAVDPALVEQAREAARVEGERAGIAAGQAKVDAIVQRYADGIARLAIAEGARARAEAASAIELAMVVAREIVGRELSLDREVLVTMLTEAVAMAGADGPVRVRVGPTDLAYLEAMRPEVLDGDVQIIEDATLGIGGVLVESEHRVVDATLETRLASIGDSLRDALGAGVLDARPDAPATGELPAAEIAAAEAEVAA